MSVYDVDIDVVSDLNVPVRLRQQVMTAWLRVLVSPVVYLQGQFNAFKASTLYYLGHNSQVCYMQAALNDTFDPVDRGIFISDGPYEDPIYSYLDDEDKPVFIDLDSEVGDSVIPDPDPVPLYTDIETYSLGVQFVVNVPSAVAGMPGYDVNYLRGLVNKYRLPGKNNYTVVYF